MMREMWDATKRKKCARTQAKYDDNSLVFVFFIHIPQKGRRKRWKKTQESLTFIQNYKEKKIDRRETTTNQTKAETKLPILCRTTHQFNRRYDFRWSWLLFSILFILVSLLEFIFELWHFIVNIWLCMP